MHAYSLLCSGNLNSLSDVGWYKMYLYMCVCLTAETNLLTEINILLLRQNRGSKFDFD